MNNCIKISNKNWAKTHDPNVKKTIEKKNETTFFLKKKNPLEPPAQRLPRIYIIDIFFCQTIFLYYILLKTMY